MLIGRSGQANYGLAKAGVVGLSKVIAKVDHCNPPNRHKSLTQTRNGALNSAFAQIRRRSFPLSSQNSAY